MPSQDQDDRTPLQLRVNGVTHQVMAEPRETLADILRDRLGLTGTHLGCEHGVCGACTVSVDGEPVRSCIVYGVQVTGRDILTIEGVTDRPDVRSLAGAFSRHGALQCGFCTPGFLMLGTCVYGGPHADPAAPVDEVVSSNVCRCGCYQGLRAAYAEVYGSGDGEPSDNP